MSSQIDGLSKFSLFQDLSLEEVSALDEMALVDGLPRSATVRACTQSALAVLI